MKPQRVVPWPTLIVPSSRGQVKAVGLLKKSGVALAAFVILWAILYANMVPPTVAIKLGEAAPDDIPVPTESVNRFETERLKREAAAAVKDVYFEDPKVLTGTENTLSALFERIGSLRRTIKENSADPAGALNVGVAELTSYLDREIGISVDEVQAKRLLEAPDEAILALENRLSELIRSLMQAGIKPDALETYRRQVESEVAVSDIPQELRPFAVQLGQRLLRPNLIFDKEETEARRKRAMDEVVPVKFAKGEIILRKGEKVTSKHIAILQDLGLLKTRSRWREMLGSGIYSAIFVAAVGAYIWLFQKDVSRDDSKVALVALVGIGVVLLGQVFEVVSGLLVPTAAAAMLIGTLIDLRLGFVVSSVLAMAVGIMEGQDPRLMAVGLIGSLAGVSGITHLGQRSDFMRAGFIVGMTNILIVLAFYISGRLPFSDSGLLKDLLWGGLNGIISAIVAMGTLPYLETLFEVITPVKLLELLNPNQPLLKRLLIEAPGTYHHSAMVANLAEAAAEAVGGNSLLARVGGYYHDIGKLKRPYFFIDNQFGVDNPHEKLAPSLSTLIITSHVKDGVELAREWHLPEAVVDFIRTHHGTSLVSYFYSRATTSNDQKAEGISEEDFRYEGPKPSTKETAIVMLADAVEAGVRSLTKPTPARIEATVRKLITDRLNDHQLDKCDLTLKDLDTIAEVFVKVLSGVFHPRIEYPDAGNREGPKSKEAAVTKDEGNRPGQT
ncbi:MAG TPA: HDIG domain-containing protein [Clostridia bacterium]|nr:HDIG domain-containing protein [Clostridia bacterium]